MCEKDSEFYADFDNTRLNSSRYCIGCKTECLSSEICPECGGSHFFDSAEVHPCRICAGQRVVTVICPRFKGRA